MIQTLTPVLKSPVTHVSGTITELPPNPSEVSATGADDQMFALVLGQHMALLTGADSLQAQDDPAAKTDALLQPGADVVPAILAAPAFFAAPVSLPASASNLTVKFQSSQLSSAGTNKLVPTTDPLASIIPAASRGRDSPAASSSLEEIGANGVKGALPLSPNLNAAVPLYLPTAPAEEPVASAVLGDTAAQFAVNSSQQPPHRAEGAAQAAPMRVDTPVGAAGWQDSFSDRVAWMVHQGRQVADLQLNPPQLGPVEVRIVLGGDQASISFTSPHGVVRDAIQAALPRLSEILQDQGMVLSDVSVATQSFTQQQSQSQANRQDDVNLPLRPLVLPDRAMALQRMQLGLVDIFA